ncbi:putative glutathione s-transferase [Phaeomoniella chlamydospora]|uniref:Putative glutathione s-transferase n=1 Tax=Phaeomoniella chlamydospora TaxID=158046 RepID=A0A0G2EQ58_PHACM|nr:putative glutathione s-transferase [Phaeomoniella chlamydospora]
MPSSHPDSDVYPEATGEAAKYFSQHKSEEPLKLYSGWFCPFVQRALLVLHEKSIPFQYIEVNPYDKPESLLKLNPRGLVPTLEVPVSPTTHKPLIESSVICEYLDEVYRDARLHGDPLMPHDPYERARARIWTGFVGSNIIPSYHRWLQFDGEAMTQGRAEFLENIRQFTEQMHPTGPFWLGEQISMPDLIIAPWVVRLWVFDHFKGNNGEWPKGPIWERWNRFVKAVEELKSVRDTLSDREHYLPLYQRYAENKAQSGAAKAIRAGKHIP